MENAEIKPDSLIISYLLLRKVVGLLGVSLPVVLVLYALFTPIGFQNTVSHFYYTEMRDIFVGIMCAIGLFLFSYNGYDRSERWAGIIACVCAIGIALLPTAPGESNLLCLQCTLHDGQNTLSHSSKYIDYLHKSFAVTLFLILTRFSLVSFPKSNVPEKEMTEGKRRRNRIYRISGSVMLIMLLVVLPDLRESIAHWHPIFWLESVVIFAFGISWLVKGKAIFGET